MQLYDFCYGIATEAERILYEENPENTIRSNVIVKYWARVNLRSRLKAEVLEGLVSEAHKATGGDLESMEKYLIDKCNHIRGNKVIKRVYISDSTVKQYSKKLGLKLKQDLQNKVIKTFTKRQTHCGMSMKKAEEKYALSGPVEVY
jgi:hypothetical protein